MWGKRKGKAPRTRHRLGGFLDEGSEIEGRYRCTGTVMLDGTLHGEITATDTLVVGDRGVVYATVQAATLVVRGEVVGNVTASERVELKRGARLTGDIEAPIVVMEEGAVHDGRCRMPANPAEASRPVVVTNALLPTPVESPVAGTVIAAGHEGPYGTRVALDHHNRARSLIGHREKLDAEAGHCRLGRPARWQPRAE
jgi:cytoskeletal protein CcmA (bactofilin family)